MVFDLRPGDFLDEEPLMLFGFTGTELSAALVVLAGVWLPVALVLGLLIQDVFIALIFFIVTYMPSVWLAAILYRHLKRGRPSRYHLHFLAHKFHKSGFFKQVQHNGSFNL